MKLLSLLFLLLALCAPNRGEKILFFFSFSSYSHRIAVWPLAEALAEKGHEVTFLQPYENKNPHPKVKDIVTPVKLAEEMSKMNPIEQRVSMGKRLTQINGLILPVLSAMTCEWIFEEDGTMDILQNSKFDLVIMDSLFNDCGYLLAYKWKAKTAIYSPSTALGTWADAFGLPVESYIPDAIISTGAGKESTLLGRIFTNVMFLSYHTIKTWIMHPMLAGYAEKYLKIENLPPIHEMEANTSLILLNTHFSEELPRSLPPLVVSVAGMHLKETQKPLPKALLDFIGNDKFIYVSFGASAKMSKAPKEIQDKFLQTFEELKDLKFVWKWEGDASAVKIPSNVFVDSWMPQQAVLGHPKASGFITHGGILGTQEGIHNAVPLIAFPMFAEQDYNADRIARTGRGFNLDIGSFTVEELKGAITAVVNDPKYKQNMITTSKLFKDRPQKPVDTAMWWIDYILRNENSHEYMMPLSVHQYWFQKRLLDVWALIFLITLIGLYIDYKIICWTCRKCKGSKKSVKNKNYLPSKKRN